MKRRVILMIIMLLFVTVDTINAKSYYGIARNSVTGVTGGFFMATTKALDSKWSSSNNTRFVLHTMWVETNTSTGSWIECGYMDGSLNYAYHKGFYTARGVVDSEGNLTYSEYKIVGPSTDTGTNHTYQIQRDGTNKWGVYVDYTLRKTFSAGSTCGRMDCGLETNYTGSTSSKWNEKSFQLLKDGTWKDWSSGSLDSTLSSISTSWDTKYKSIFTSKNN